GDLLEVAPPGGARAGGLEGGVEALLLGRRHVLGHLRGDRGLRLSQGELEELADVHPGVDEEAEDPQAGEHDQTEAAEDQRLGAPSRPRRTRRGVERGRWGWSGLDVRG